MSTDTWALGARIEKVDVSAYQIPTETEHESDGTLVWDSTTMVLVELHCAGRIGMGYTYCDPAAAQVISSKLAGLLEGIDPLMPQKAWAQMQVQARQLGHAGVAAMAISAVAVALWDLKAKLLGVCLADLPGAKLEAARNEVAAIAAAKGGTVIAVGVDVSRIDDLAKRKEEGEEKGGGRRGRRKGGRRKRGGGASVGRRAAGPCCATRLRQPPAPACWSVRHRVISA